MSLPVISSGYRLRTAGSELALQQTVQQVFKQLMKRLKQDKMPRKFSELNTGEINALHFMVRRAAFPKNYRTVSKLKVLDHSTAQIYIQILSANEENRGSKDCLVVIHQFDQSLVSSPEIKFAINISKDNPLTFLDPKPEPKKKTDQLRCS